MIFIIIHVVIYIKGFFNSTNPPKDVKHFFNVLYTKTFINVFTSESKCILLKY